MSRSLPPIPPEALEDTAAAPPPRRRPAPGLPLLIYRAATAAAAPAAKLVLSVRERRGKEAPERRGERLGQPGLPRPPGPLLWCHAASVGETNAVLPLLDAVRGRRPDLAQLLTTATVTSARLAEERLDGAVMHQYVPLDVPRFARAFLDHWRPDLALFVESEIWPNFVLEIAGRGIPLVLVNGRLSERSYRRWHRRPGMSRPLFGSFDLVLAQNETMARQFAELGAPDARACGNLKMDAPAPPVDQAALHLLRSATHGRPILLAASTHAGEEEILVKADAAIRARHGELLTVIAPRHPDRGSQIVARLRAQGLTVAQRSAGEAPDRSCRFYVADTIGELGLFYTLAPVAYIGGSLVSRGGQNPVEAVRLDAAVLSGPHYHNFADAYAALLEVEGCAVVASAEALADTAADLLADEVARRAMLNGARAAVERMHGALGRTLEAVAALLPPRQGAERAS